MTDGFIQAEPELLPPREIFTFDVYLVLEITMISTMQKTQMELQYKIRAAGYIARYEKQH